MTQFADIHSTAHAIQLALTPVFLLTGIGSLLGVLTNRLSRIVDRYRVLERLLASLEPLNTAMRQDGRQEEMAVLTQRSGFIHLAIRLCTLSALLISLVVAMLFIGALLSADLSVVIAVVFTLAMLSLIAGLLSFLREINLSTGGILVIKKARPWWPHE